MSRRDVIIVASVSAIYNLGSPEEYKGLLVFAERGESVIPGTARSYSTICSFSYPEDFIKRPVRKFYAQGWHPGIDGYTPYDHLMDCMTEYICPYRQNPVREIYTLYITCAIRIGECLQEYGIYLHCRKPVYEFAEILVSLYRIRVINKIKVYLNSPCISFITIRVLYHFDKFLDGLINNHGTINSMKPINMGNPFQH